MSPSFNEVGSLVTSKILFRTDKGGQYENVVEFVMAPLRNTRAKIKQNKFDGNVHGLEFPLYPVGIT
ncbi:hypothetical protein NC651_026338 [Populus alba x Populus x berolinensis]|nr:hypothetical protein NC651_026338 [Populus alba x Populus x berolinensis]